MTTAVEGHGKLPSDVQLAFYRVAQEAFNNINKHARAAQVTVHLSIDEPRAADLGIRDDGCGFDCRACDGDGLVHFGLTTMAERASSCGRAAIAAQRTRAGHGGAHWLAGTTRGQGMTAQRPIEVLLVDDHRVVRRGARPSFCRSQTTSNWSAKQKTDARR